MIGAQPLPDANAVAWLDAIHRGLAEEGWIEGANVHVEPRFTAGTPGLSLAYAAELAAMQPDVFQCGTNENALNAHNASHNTPLVFVAVSDPVGAGLVESINRPGGNVTGVTHAPDSIGGKWVSLLLEMAPLIRRIGFIHNPARPSFRYVPSFVEASIAAGREPIEIAVSAAEEIGPAIDAFAAVPATGLIVSTNNWSSSNRATFEAAVNRNSIPTIWGLVGVEEGLISYVVDTTDSFRLGAVYVGRILNGVLPADLPVLSPSRHVMTVNTRVAAAQGLTVPVTILAVADRIIE